MRIRKLGIEWGSAYEQAQPVEISHGDSRVVVYVTESNQLEIVTDQKVTINSDGIAIRV